MFRRTSMPDRGRVVEQGIPDVHQMQAEAIELRRQVDNARRRMTAVRLLDYGDLPILQDRDHLAQAGRQQDMGMGMHVHNMNTMGTYTLGLDVMDGTANQGAGLAMQQGLTNRYDLAYTTEWFIPKPKKKVIKNMPTEDI